MPAKFWTEEPEDTRSIEEIIEQQSRESDFKVGDWVVVLPEDKFYYNCEQGKAQQIVRVRPSNGLPYVLSFSDGRANNQYTHIRRATSSEMPEVPVIVTSDIAYVGMKVKPGRDYGTIESLKTYAKPDYTCGVIKTVGAGGGYEDFVDVGWREAPDATSWMRVGKRLGSYPQGYDLYVDTD